MEPRDLVRLLRGLDNRPGLRLRQAVVQSVQAGPPASLTVRIGGDTVNISGVRYLASYTSPAGNDTVWLLQSGTDLLVLGKLA